MKSNQHGWALIGQFTFLIAISFIFSLGEKKNAFDDFLLILVILLFINHSITYAVSKRKLSNGLIALTLSFLTFFFLFYGIDKTVTQWAAYAASICLISIIASAISSTQGWKSGIYKALLPYSIGSIILASTVVAYGWQSVSIVAIYFSYWVIFILVKIHKYIRKRNSKSNEGQRG